MGHESRLLGERRLVRFVMLPDLDDGQIVDIADKWPKSGLEEHPNRNLLPC